MEANLVKESVTKQYGKLAKQRKGSIFSKFFSCCDLEENAREVGKAIGYSSSELDGVPENSNLGIGCGNPSAMTRINEGDIVIDLGSGAGFDAFIVAPTVGETGKVIGIDLSDDMLALANKNLKKSSYSNIDFIKGDIESLPLEKDMADHIISNCVINLSLNKGAVYKEAYRVLKKGGTLSISDIVLEKELPAIVRDSLAGHIACVSGAEKVSDYMNYVRAAGFKDIKIESKSDFPLELMLADPQLAKVAQEMNFSLDSNQARDIASRVKSITLTATK